MSKLVSFENLVKALSRTPVSLNPSDEPSLLIAEHEPCYIKQDLTSEDKNTLNCEVVLVAAAAAVGKSTLARELSATCQIPLLDLGVTGVFTHSLRGIIDADVEGENSLRSFVQGGFPIIVDALDESRILSGEKGFEDFLRTTWTLLTSNRHTVEKPKLVMIGRPETCELVEISLDKVTYSRLKLDFFDRSESIALVDAHASVIASPKSAYHKNPSAAEVVIDSYFSSIAAALGLSHDELWSSAEGRSFAGYAPVLAALGQLLARTDNFAALNATFEKVGTRSAWASIERIAESVMEREHDKLVRNLQLRVSRPVPKEAYDVEEQYALLIGYIQSGEFRHTKRVKMQGGDDDLAYRQIAETWLGEHPFLTGRDPANAVLGAMVLARAVVDGRIDEGAGFVHLMDASSQPFLWRSFQSALIPDSTTLIDGRCLGYLLASLTSDPVDRTTSVTVRGTDDDSPAQATIFTSDSGRHAVELLPPVRFYGRAENIDTRTDSVVELYGYQRGNNHTATYLTNASITARRIDFETDSTVLDGTVWLDAREVRASSQINLQVLDRAEIGWAGVFPQRYPWNRQETSLLRRPGDRPESNPLFNLLEGARLRLSTAGPAVLFTDLTIANSEMKWFQRVFGDDVMRQLFSLMISHGLAKDSGPFSVGGRQKVHLRLINVTWEQLETAYLERTGDERIVGFLEKARLLFPTTDE